MRRLNHMLLNKPWVMEEIKRENTHKKRGKQIKMATQYIKICEISQNQCKMEVYSNYYLHQKVEKNK